MKKDTILILSCLTVALVLHFFFTPDGFTPRSRTEAKKGTHAAATNGAVKTNWFTGAPTNWVQPKPELWVTNGFAPITNAAGIFGVWETDMNVFFFSGVYPTNAPESYFSVEFPGDPALVQIVNNGTNILTITATNFTFGAEPTEAARIFADEILRLWRQVKTNEEAWRAAHPK